MKQVPSNIQSSLRRLIDWATDLEQRCLASLKTVLGDGRQILLVWLPGEQAGLVSIWNDGGASISLWRSVFVRHAWEQIDPIERLTGKAMSQGSGVRDPSPELLELLSTAYEQAATGAPSWDGLSHYVTFGEGEERNWEDARKFGFVSAGGGAWYSNTLRQVPPGSRVFAYIPKRSRVKGYVGVVTGKAGYWHHEQMDQLRLEHGLQLLIPPDAGNRTTSRPGWNGGRYAFMRRVLQTELGKTLYKQRKALIEPVFGHTKFNRRIERFQRRGLAACRAEWPPDRRDAQSPGMNCLARASAVASGREASVGRTGQGLWENVGWAGRAWDGLRARHYLCGRPCD